MVTSTKYLKLKLILSLVFISFISACQEKDDAYLRRHLLGTWEIADSVYIEMYLKASYGVYGGDIYVDFLTDSLNFRVLLDSYDTGDDENTRTNIHGDSIIFEIYKTINFLGNEYNQPKIVGRIDLSLDSLKKLNNYTGEKGKFLPKPPPISEEENTFCKFSNYNYFKSSTMPKNLRYKKEQYKIKSKVVNPSDSSIRIDKKKILSPGYDSLIVGDTFITHNFYTDIQITKDEINVFSDTVYVSDFLKHEPDLLNKDLYVLTDVDALAYIPDEKSYIFTGKVYIPLTDNIFIKYFIAYPDSTIKVITEPSYSFSADSLKNIDRYIFLDSMFNYHGKKRGWFGW